MEANIGGLIYAGSQMYDNLSMNLGLDISTSVVGVCVIDTAGNIVELSSIDLRKIDNFWEKTDKVREALELLRFNFALKKEKIERVFVEQNLQAFRPGFSSAQTIVLLARMNGIVSYIARVVFGVDVEYINVNEARKLAGVKIDKKDKTRSTKEKIFDQVKASVPPSFWVYKTIKAGKRKGDQELDDCNYDMADAYVIVRAGFLKTRP